MLPFMRARTILVLSMLVVVLVGADACNSAAEPAARPATAVEPGEAEPPAAEAAEGAPGQDETGVLVPADPAPPPAPVGDTAASGDDDPESDTDTRGGAVVTPQGSDAKRPPRGSRPRGNGDGWNSPTAPLGRDDMDRAADD